MLFFSFRKSLFNETTAQVFSEKANFNDNGGFVVGTQTIFVGIQEVSVFRGIQKVSARRVHKELINYNLYLFA